MARQRKPPKNTTSIQFDSRLSLQRIAEGLRSVGILLKTNPESFQLFAVEAPKPKERQQ